jgi:trehalose utilization protein
VTTTPIRVTVWNENIHERRVGSHPAELYPAGIHGAIADGLRELLGSSVEVRTATMEQPEHGLPQEVVDTTDVLLWWGHEDHPGVADEVVDRVHDAVLGGMGLLVLHSGHYSKIFRRLMGTTCSLRWSPDVAREVVWTVAPTHPIAVGVPDPLVIDEQEMYGEFFDIPVPEELIFLSTFSGGEVFRSGATWTRGFGKVFYFSPGDQEYPVYRHHGIRRVLANGVRWAAPVRRGPRLDATMHRRGWVDGTPLSD